MPTKREIVEAQKVEKRIGPVDYALPQQWLDQAAEYMESNRQCLTAVSLPDPYGAILGQFVWVYPRKRGSLSGKPHPLTPQARQILRCLPKRMYGKS